MTARDHRPSRRVRGLGLATLSLALAWPIASARAQGPEKPPSATTITVEGCLTRDGDASRSSAAQLYVLNTGTPTSAVASPGAGAVPAPPQPKMYVLRSTDATPVALASLVNHKVRVTGSSTGPATTAPLAGRSPEATPYQAPVATPGAGATGTPFDTTNLPTLVVTTITSVASTCR